MKIKVRCTLIQEAESGLYRCTFVNLEPSDSWPAFITITIKDSKSYYVGEEYVLVMEIA